MVLLVQIERRGPLVIGIYASLPSRLYGRVARNERGGSLNVEVRMYGCG